MRYPANDTARRTGPRVGECGLQAQDTGLDLWLSRQYEQGRPSPIMQCIALQVWTQFQMQNHKSVCPAARARILNELDLTEEKVAELYTRYGWIFLSHGGPR